MKEIPFAPLRFHNGFGDSYLHKRVQSSGPVFVLALCGELRGGNPLLIHLRGIKAEWVYAQLATLLISYRTSTQENLVAPKFDTDDKSLPSLRLSIARLLGALKKHECYFCLCNG